jgi:acyl-CoA synthetase (NDP forming)
MVLCRSAGEARQAFANLQAPVVAKGCSPDVPHKSEYGLVRLGIRSAEDAARAAHMMLQRMEELEVRSEGVILAEMKKADVELLLGGRFDPKFGPVITVGAGGKYVEALDDVGFSSRPSRGMRRRPRSNPYASRRSSEPYAEIRPSMWMRLSR